MNFAVYSSCMLPRRLDALLILDVASCSINAVTLPSVHVKGTFACMETAHKPSCCSYPLCNGYITLKRGCYVAVSLFPLQPQSSRDTDLRELIAERRALHRHQGGSGGGGRGGGGGGDSGEEEEGPGEGRSAAVSSVVRIVERLVRLKFYTPKKKKTVSESLNELITLCVCCLRQGFICYCGAPVNTDAIGICCSNILVSCFLAN